MSKLLKVKITKVDADEVERSLSSIEEDAKKKVEVIHRMRNPTLSLFSYKEDVHNALDVLKKSFQKQGLLKDGSKFDTKANAILAMIK